MLLQTSIKPRRDGTVAVTGVDGARLVFAPNAAGELECEVAHEPTIAQLFSTQNFYPASEEDYQLALALSSAATEPGEESEPADPGEPDPAALASKTDDALDLPDDVGDMNAMPVEAQTPPQTAPDRAARKNGALQAAAKARK